MRVSAARARDQRVQESPVSAAFTAFLRDREFDPTGKLIGRLMSHDPRDLAAILEALRPPKRQLLRRAILREGRYGGPLFKEKILVVRRAVFGE